VGETADGEPIFEIRSVQLVLPDDAAHFRRLVSCAKCGRTLAGPVVANPGDLDVTVHSVICKDCVATAPMMISRADRPAIGPRSDFPTPSNVPATVAPETRLGTSGDSRLTALEGRIAELASLLEAQGADVSKALRAQVPLASFAAGAEELERRQQTLGGALARTMERLDRIAEAKALPAGDLDDRIEAAVRREAARIDAGQEAAVEALQAAMEEQTAQIRAEISRVASSHDEVKGTQQDLSRRTDDVIERLTEDVAPLVGRLASLEERLAQLQGALEAEAIRTDSEPDVVPVSAELVRIEQQLNDRVDHLAVRVTEAIDSNDRRADEMDLRVAHATEAPAARLDALGEEVVTLASRLEQIPRTLAESVVAPVAREASATSARLESLEMRLQELQHAVGAATAAPAPEFVTRAEVDEELRKADEEQLARLRAVELRMAEAAEAPSARLESLRAQVVELASGLENAQAALSVQAERAGASVTELTAGNEDLRRSQEALQVGLQGVLDRAREAEDRLAQTLELRVAEAVEPPTARVEALQIDVVGLQSRLEQVRTALAAQAERSGEVMARAGADSEDVRRAQEELRSDLQGVLDRLPGLQHAVVEQVEGKLVELEEQLNQRLDGADEAARQRTARVEAVRSDVVGLASSLDQVRSALEAQAEMVARTGVDEAGLRRSQEELRADLQGVVDRLHSLQDSVVARVDEKLLGLEEQMNQKFALAGDAENQRSARLEAVQAGVVGLESTVEQVRSALAAQGDRADDAIARLTVGETELRARLDGVLDSLQTLQRAVKAELATREEIDGKVVRVEEQLTQRLGRLADQVERRSARDDERLQALVQHLAEEGVEERIARVEDEQADARAGLASALRQLADSAVARDQTDEAIRTIGQRVDENGAVSARLDTDHDELRRRYDDVQRSIERLQTSLDDEVAPPRVVPADVDDVRDTLARINLELNDRLEALSERTRRAADVGGEGLQSLSRQLEEAAARLPEALDALRSELQADLAAAVADVRTSVPEPTTGDAGRIDALEKAAAERDAEVADLLDYHAALDSGLGELRTELAKVVAATTAQADTEGHERLLAQVEALEKTVAATARASAKASSLGPIRKDVAALSQQVAEQEEALAKVAKSIESLRRKIPAPAPATTKKAARPTK
jgi:chromosome segregation ATPase